MGIIYSNLLIKAQRDKSKLVQVQRTVSRGGKTFTQNFWVKPSQVKSTDRVVGGQQNLVPQPTTPNLLTTPTGQTIDTSHFEILKAKKDKTEAMDYLKSCGITWKENPHAGINFMRAMMAYNAVLKQAGAASQNTQPNSQPTTNTAQSTSST